MDIFAAIARGDEATVVALVAADPALAAVRSPEGATPVLHALYHQEPGIARVLAAQVASSGSALNLAEAAALDETDRVAELLDLGTPVDGRTDDGFTPLQLAAFFGAPAAAQLLIGAGADVDAVAENPMRIRPLHAAAAARHGTIVSALIEAGADVNATQRHGWTPLHTAAQHGDAAMVAELLAAGASLTAANDDGDTPADLAARAGHEGLLPYGSG